MVEPVPLLEMLPLDDGIPAGLLYHYTTLDGLLGILDSDSIRATHIRYLNDRAELKDAFERGYPKLVIKALFPDIEENDADKLSNIVNPTGDKFHAYIVSFTDEKFIDGDDTFQPGDRLSQWRAYSGSTGGFSLGFDPKCLSLVSRPDHLEETGALQFLLRCIYATASKRSIAEEIGANRSTKMAHLKETMLRKFTEKEQRTPDTTEEVEINKAVFARILGASAADFFLRAASFKDGSFSEENEWRIVHFIARDRLLLQHCLDLSAPIVQLRTGKFGITPYISLPLGLKTEKSPLKRIVIGPTAHMEDALVAVKLSLESKGLAVKGESSDIGIEVIPSKIPYRNW